MSYATDAAIGMMDGAYFTSRKELLDFFNGLLDLNLTKIEQTASGAVACQMTEYIFPNSIPMSRVNWEARASHEYVHNYKLLQNGFNKNKIQKHIDVDKLIRAKYQDNLEFCQWLKAFHDQTAGGRSRDNYDPIAVRARGKGGKSVPSVQRKGATKPPAAKPAARAQPVARPQPVSKSASGGSTRPSSGSGRTSGSTNAAAVSRTSAAVSRALKENATHNATGSVGSGGSKRSTSDNDAANAAANAALVKSNDELKETSRELERNLATNKTELQAIETERDFYFSKLRDIEIMMQVYQEDEDAKKKEKGGKGNVKEANALIKRIFKIMYATQEDGIEVDDEGNLIGCEISVDISDDEEEEVAVEEAFEDGDYLEAEDDEENLLASAIDERVAAKIEDSVIEPLSSATGIICLDDDDDDDESLLGD